MSKSLWWFPTLLPICSSAVPASWASGPALCSHSLYSSYAGLLIALQNTPVWAYPRAFALLFSLHKIPSFSTFPQPPIQGQSSPPLCPTLHWFLTISITPICVTSWNLELSYLCLTSMLSVSPLEGELHEGRDGVCLVCLGSPVPRAVHETRGGTFLPPLCGLKEPLRE